MPKIKYRPLGALCQGDNSEVFIHRLLETNPVPALWTANDLQVPGATALRRMTLIVEMKTAPPRVREKIWRRHLSERLIRSLAEGGARKAFSLCVYGPPGTGKSAFTRYLAEKMGLEVLQKRVSDLFSMWVGETEKAIARAFEEAQETDAFLVFDEADSLLADRGLAIRSWEITQVNEMLTWMESHDLPFACTTNLVDRLDPASLRRFTLKIKFDFMSGTQIRKAFLLYFGAEAPKELLSIRTLTPGDFAVVRRRAEITGARGNSHALVEMLAQECAMKRERARSIGFLRESSGAFRSRP